MIQLTHQLASFLVLFLAAHIYAEFNFEAGLRIHERINEFVSIPASILDFVNNYQKNEGLDRDKFLKLGDALIKSYPGLIIYYGLENGELAGNFYNPRYGEWREPGNGGYIVGNNDESNKHYMTCVAQNGTTKPCNMNVGDEYISCINNCSLQPCENEQSQRNCTVLQDEMERASCEMNIIWCQAYEIKKIKKKNGPRGYIPLLDYCLDGKGLPSQEMGKIYNNYDDDGVAGNCYHQDKVTLVDRNIAGNYSYCNSESAKDTCSSSHQSSTVECNTTFVGAFVNWNYDPRYRPWYIEGKRAQKPYWTTPYIFVDISSNMGTTYIKPMYKTDEEGRKVFDGLLALDYKLLDIADFLSASYEDVIVAIIEESSPNYVIATSKGGIGSKFVNASDETQICPSDTDASECKIVRIEVNELDDAASKAFSTHLEAGFPEFETLPITFNGVAYASQTKLLTLEGGIDWRLLILIPVEMQREDTLMIGDPLVAAIFVPSLLGFTICSIFFALFIKNREHREIAYSDWRFTGAFTFNCALVNLACLSFIGPNTNELCLLRMWIMHLSYIRVLAPLFVKTYRMYLLVGTQRVMRQTISHSKTFFMMVLFVLVEILILLIFTFVDPSKKTSIIEQYGSDIIYRKVCSHETAAFFWTQCVYEGGLLLIGCYLAYKTTNMNEEFGEPKQLIFSMYNIAFVASIIIIVANVVDVYERIIYILLTVGVFWCTIFSSGVFVLPRLLQLKERLGGGENGHRIKVSGVTTPCQ